jgi:hypothetical protein
MVGVNTLKKSYEQANIGEFCFINAIGLTPRAIDLLREYIQKSKIAPVETMLIKMIKKESIDKFLNGEAIAPQMTYIKIS